MARKTEEEDRERRKGMREFERQIGAAGRYAGVDEAGRGPLAGPVVAACVILPPDCEIRYLNDSKKLSAKRREALYEEICEKAVAFGIGMAGPELIDEVNILQATYAAMRDAVRAVAPPPELLLNDAVTIPDLAIPQIPIVKGDSKSLSIAAASILAKVTRDRYMIRMDALYPQYGFARHKGYGTKAHREALQRCGPCPIHRRTFLGKILGESDG